MECRKRLTPGMNGTKRYQPRFGERLLFVRYRHDPERQRRLTTVELIVDGAPLPPPRNAVEKALFPHPNQTVYVRIEYQETELRGRAKAAGAKWDADRRLWKMSYHVATQLGLRGRIEGREVVNNGIL